MAQVKSLHSADINASFVKPTQTTLGQEVKAKVTLPTAISTKTLTSHIEQEDYLTPRVKQESIATTDDEVQFVFSVPRRRKRRRRG
jgi:hypothetical protein